MSKSSKLSENEHINAVNTRKKKKHVTFKGTFEVEEICDKRQVKDRDEYEYLVKWKNYDNKDNTWEPAGHLHQATAEVERFEKQLEQERLMIEASNKQDKEKSIVYLPKLEKCTTCEKEFVTETALHLHNYYDHAVLLPIVKVQHLDINTNREVIKNLQNSEPEFRCIFNSQLGTIDYSQLNVNERRVLNQNEFVVSEDGLLYCCEIPTSRTRSKIRTQIRLCIPKTERKRILQEYHDKMAHAGIVHLYDKLRDVVWWPRMLRDIVKYVSKCELCQRSKGNRKSVLTRSMNIPTRPWSHISVDHVGPLPASDNGNKYILVVIDRFTRYAEAFPVESLSSEETAKILVEKIICRYGMPEVIGSDRGSVFVGITINQIFKILGVSRIKTTAFHPQSNGVVEIFNKTMKSSLRIWAKENQKDWDELLPFALFAYNTAFHSLMRETPYYLNHGIQARTITDDITQSDYYVNGSIHGYARELVKRLSDTHHRVREILEQVNVDREKEIDEEKAIVFSVGDQVLLFDPTTSEGVSKKLVRRWKGPYTVITCNSDVNYTIIKENKTMVVNIERLRKFSDNEIANVSENNINEFELMKLELDALNKTIQELKQREIIVQNQYKLSESATTENNESFDTSMDNEQSSVGVNCLVVPDYVISLIYNSDYVKSP
jgi:transposase InsO family protein